MRRVCGAPAQVPALQRISNKERVKDTYSAQGTHKLKLWLVGCRLARKALIEPAECDDERLTRAVPVGAQKVFLAEWLG